MNDPDSSLNAAALTEHGRFLRSIARSLITGSDEVEDLVQDSWLAFLQRGHSREGAARSWLAMVLRRKAIDRHRRTEARSRYEQAAARAEVGASSEADPEVLRDVIATVLDLDEPYRSTLLARHWEGLPRRRIAARDRVPVETVKSRLRRGHALVRQRIEDRHPDGAWRASLGMVVGLSSALAPIPAVQVGGAVAWTKTKIAAGLGAMVLLVSVGLYALIDDPPAGAQETGVASGARLEADRVRSDAAKDGLPTRAFRPTEEAGSGQAGLILAVVDTGGVPVPGARVRFWEKRAHLALEWDALWGDPSDELRRRPPMIDLLTDSQGEVRVGIQESDSLVLLVEEGNRSFMSGSYRWPAEQTPLQSSDAESRRDAEAIEKFERAGIVLHRERLDAQGARVLVRRATVELQEPARILVRTVDARGDPVPNVQVALAFDQFGEDAPYERPITNAEGEAEVVIDRERLLGHRLRVVALRPTMPVSERAESPPSSLREPGAASEVIMLYSPIAALQPPVVTLVVPDPCSLKVVVEDEDGIPLAGSWALHLHQISHRDVARADHRFIDRRWSRRFDGSEVLAGGLSAGTEVLVSLTGEGYAPRTRRVAIPESGGAIEVRVSPGAPLGFLRLPVRAPDGAPLVGWQVEVDYVHIRGQKTKNGGAESRTHTSVRRTVNDLDAFLGPKYHLTLETDEAGTVLIPISSGRRQVRRLRVGLPGVMDPGAHGHTRAEAIASLNPGEVRHLDPMIVRIPKTLVRGTVRDRAGHPVAGAWVTLAPAEKPMWPSTAPWDLSSGAEYDLNGPLSATTDEFGNYTISGEMPSEAFLLRAFLHRSFLGQREFVPGEEQHDFVLPETGEIEISFEGIGVHGRDPRVLLSPHGAPGGFIASRFDTSGRPFPGHEVDRLSLHAIPVGLYDLHLWNQNAPVRRLERIEVRAGETTQSPRLTDLAIAPEESRQDLLVTDSAGYPIAGAALETVVEIPASQAGFARRESTVITDASGRATLYLGRNETTHLKVMAAGYQSATRILPSPKQTELRVELADASIFSIRITGLAQHLSSKPGATARIDIAPPRVPESMVRPKLITLRPTGPDLFEARGLDAGVHRLTLVISGGAKHESLSVHLGDLSIAEGKSDRSRAWEMRDLLAGNR